METFIKGVLIQELKFFYPTAVPESLAQKYSLSALELEYLIEARSLAFGKSISSPSEIWKPLASPLESLSISSVDTSNHSPVYGFPIESLEKGKFPFPEKGIQIEPSKAQNKIKEFAEQLTEHSDLDGNTWLSLLEKYAAFVPIPISHVNDVSLFDHVKSVVGLASILYRNNELGEKDLGTPFQLLGADISGIQDFIYDIISKSAAKNLKGRSFYLQMLIDSVLHDLLSKLKLTYANVIYASGGGMFLLIPNTQGMDQFLVEIEEYWENQIFREHRDTLFLGMALEPLQKEHFLSDQLPQKWKSLNDRLRKKKQQRYAKTLLSRFDDFFKPQGEGGDTPRDAITGEEIPKGAKRFKIDTREGSSSDVILQRTQDQIQLGKELRTAAAWVISDQPVPGEWKSYQPGEGQVYNYLVPIQQSKNLFNDDTSYSNHQLVRTLNNPEFMTLGDQKAGSWGFTFYGGNDFPADESGDHRSFDQLAGRTEADSDEPRDSEGFTRLGILRMDVDSLGHLFVHGMGKESRTLSRYSALSRTLDYFFKGHLNQIWGNNPDYKEYTSIIYAGGDDLFIVGRWDLLISMAEQISSDFSDWSCHNSEISISGGIAIVTPRFPLSKAANMAADAEKAAKFHEYILMDQTLEKNAFSLLGIPLNWKHEYPVVKSLKEKIHQMIDDDRVPRSLIAKVRSHYLTYCEETKKDQTQSWRWTMAYDFSRMIRTLKDPQLQAELDQIKIACFTDSYEGYTRDEAKKNHAFIELLYLATRWAELSLRTN